MFWGVRVALRLQTRVCVKEQEGNGAREADPWRTRAHSEPAAGSASGHYPPPLVQALLHPACRAILSENRQQGGSACLRNMMTVPPQHGPQKRPLMPEVLLVSQGGRREGETPAQPRRKAHVVLN